MALWFTSPVVAGLALLSLASSAGAQTPAPSEQTLPSGEALDTSLSPECRVPGSKLYALAPLSAVRAALDEKRPIKVLALGPTGTGSFTLGSASATYPLRLEG